jgi:ACS family sodium-dependent inorganic phosphate cotransporter
MYGLLNWLPTFFKDFYGVEIADLATYTLLPYIVQGGLGAASGVLAGVCCHWGNSISA